MYRREEAPEPTSNLNQNMQLAAGRKQIGQATAKNLKKEHGGQQRSWKYLCKTFDFEDQ